LKKVIKLVDLSIQPLYSDVIVLLSSVQLQQHLCSQINNIVEY